MITANDIKRFSKVSTKNLKLRAVKVFHKFIRERDAGLPCISCGLFKELQAGHFKSAGSHNHIRFDEDNVHGQCLRCNFYLQQSDTLYRENLIKKIGVERVERLDFLASQKGPHKTERLFLIETILKYS